MASSYEQHWVRTILEDPPTFEKNYLKWSDSLNQLVLSSACVLCDFACDG